MSFRWGVCDILKEGEIYISEELWGELRSFPEETTCLLKEAILCHDVPLPSPSISWQEASEDFCRLKKDETRIQEGTWLSKYLYKYPLQNAWIRGNNKGLKSSDYFHRGSRMSCDGRGYPSPVRTWSNGKFLEGVLKALWTMNYQYVDRSILMRAIEVRKYVASQFKPSIAKAIYELFTARRVLDFSAGWGDRLAGALASSCVEEYAGVDPHLELHSGYQKQVQAFGRPSLTARFFPVPAEEMVLPEEHFDLVFTSPPYFDKERYSHRDTQSWVRYRKLGEWLEKFLFPACERAWRSLRRGGVMAINISDIRSTKRIPGSKVREVGRICDPMNDFLATLPGAHCEGAIGLAMSGRPRGEPRCEPIWTWRKT
jgi:hypothetical protein